MPNQKGSLKDRIRSWILFLNYKLKLKKKKKEEKSRTKLQRKEMQIKVTGKYYSKPKVFGLTILGLFLGLFESKEKKQVKSLEKRIDDLEVKLSLDSLDYDLSKEIEAIEKEIKIVKVTKSDKNININKCDKKLNEIKVKINKKQQEKDLNVTQKNQGKDLLTPKVKELLKSENTTKKQVNTSTNKNLKTKKDKSQKNIEERKQKTGVYMPVLETKIFNKDLKKYNKELKEINNKIKTTTNYNELYEYEFLIKQLKIKVNELLKKYESLKKYPGFHYLSDMVIVKDIDEFNLRIDNKKIKETLDLCETNLMIIENKKKEILNSKKENVETKTDKKKISKEETTNVKKDDKKLEDNDRNKLSELILANKIVSDNLIKEKRKIMRFNRQVSNMSFKRRKYSIFYYTKNLVSSIVNFGLSLFPISLFKNKMLGGLVSGIMINNSLRSVRKILKPDMELEYMYMNIEKELLSINNSLDKMIYVCDDSLQQIDDIRKTIYKNYGNDAIYNESITSYLSDLNKIESKILYEQSTILSMNENIKIVRQKNKQKVKKINEYC